MLRPTGHSPALAILALAFALSLASAPARAEASPCAEPLHGLADGTGRFWEAYEAALQELGPAPQLPAPDAESLPDPRLRVRLRIHAIERALRELGADPRAVAEETIRHYSRVLLPWIHREIDRALAWVGRNRGGYDVFWRALELDPARVPAEEAIARAETLLARSVAARIHEGVARIERERAQAQALGAAAQAAALERGAAREGVRPEDLGSYAELHSLFVAAGESGEPIVARAVSLAMRSAPERHRALLGSLRASLWRARVARAPGIARTLLVAGIPEPRALPAAPGIGLGRLERQRSALAEERARLQALRMRIGERCFAQAIAPDPRCPDWAEGFLAGHRRYRMAYAAYVRSTGYAERSSAGLDGALESSPARERALAAAWPGPPGATDLESALLSLARAEKELGRLSAAEARRAGERLAAFAASGGNAETGIARIERAARLARGIDPRGRAPEAARPALRELLSERVSELAEVRLRSPRAAELQGRQLLAKLRGIGAWAEEDLRAAFRKQELAPRLASRGGDAFDEPALAWRRLGAIALARDLLASGLDRASLREEREIARAWTDWLARIPEGSRGSPGAEAALERLARACPPVGLGPEWREPFWQVAEAFLADPALSDASASVSLGDNGLADAAWAGELGWALEPSVRERLEECRRERASAGSAGPGAQGFSSRVPR